MSALTRVLLGLCFLFTGLLVVGAVASGDGLWPVVLVVPTPFIALGIARGMSRDNPRA